MYEILPHCDAEGSACCCVWADVLTILLYSLLEMPTVTPAYSEGVCSAALICQTASRSMRCCGSIRALSDVEILNAQIEGIYMTQKSSKPRLLHFGLSSLINEPSINEHARNNIASPKDHLEICVGRLEHASNSPAVDSLLL